MIENNRHVLKKHIILKEGIHLQQMETLNNYGRQVYTHFDAGAWINVSAHIFGDLNYMLCFKEKS